MTAKEQIRNEWRKGYVFKRFIFKAKYANYLPPLGSNR